jgi:hypothetical protein
MAAFRYSFAIFLFANLAFAQQNPPARPAPKLEPVAETKLLMQGLAQSNFKGLERILENPPQENQAWVFARGQALLIGETANLLMLRPPQKQGQEAWFDRAADLRTQAVGLARNIASKDYDRSRASFVALANSCNRCHQQFRINVQIAPFADAEPGRMTE